MRHIWFQKENWTIVNKIINEIKVYRNLSSHSFNPSTFFIAFTFLSLFHFPAIYRIRHNDFLLSIESRECKHTQTNQTLNNLSSSSNSVVFIPLWNTIVASMNQQPALLLNYWISMEYFRQTNKHLFLWTLLISIMKYKELTFTIILFLFQSSLHSIHSKI